MISVALWNKFARRPYKTPAPVNSAVSVSGNTLKHAMARKCKERLMLSLSPCTW